MCITEAISLFNTTISKTPLLHRWCSCNLYKQVTNTLYRLKAMKLLMEVCSRWVSRALVTHTHLSLALRLHVICRFPAELPWFLRGSVLQQHHLQWTVDRRNRTNWFAAMVASNHRIALDFSELWKYKNTLATSRQSSAFKFKHSSYLSYIWQCAACFMYTVYIRNSAMISDYQNL